MDLNMNRRAAIRNMALILGSVAVLPSCLNDDKGKPIVELKHLKLNREQEDVVSNLAETILPKTDTPGARELGINLFVFKMIDDCMPKEAQDAFLDGVGDFNDKFKDKYSKDFNAATAQERTAFVTDLEKQLNQPKPKAKDGDKKEDEPKYISFYQTVKGQTVFGYTTSKYFMTKQVVYELVPGRYNAKVKVKEGASA